MYQPVPPSAEPIQSYINQYQPILTQYHHISTSTTYTDLVHILTVIIFAQIADFFQKLDPG